MDHPTPPPRERRPSRRAARFAAFAAGILAFAGAIDRAGAFPSRVSNLPNGSVNSCHNCHMSPFGGDDRNPFGQAVEALIPIVGENFWGQMGIHETDSDGDGISNGAELQDPTGAWRPMMPQPGDPALVTNPGFPPPVTPTPSPSPTPSPLPTLVPTPALDIELVPFFTGLNNPTSVTNAGDGSGRLFVTERAGRILVADAQGTLADQPFLDLSAAGTGAVDSSEGEQGLFSLTFHPDYETNGRFFVCYSRDFQNQYAVAEYVVSPEDPNRAQPLERTIYTQDRFTTFHYAGNIAFGPDGYLYMSSGDGTDWRQSQDISNPFGALLRIDVDNPPPGGATYNLPPDNPFLSVPGAAREIFAYGFRNPWRFSFDRGTGDLYLGDLGHLGQEEIDLIVQGGNYGWGVVEGLQCFDPPEGCDPSGFISPIEAYVRFDLFDEAGTRLTGGCGVAGGYVYRGTLYPEFEGLYFFADWCAKLWTLHSDGQGGRFRVLRHEGIWPDTYVGFGEDEGGELYLINFLPGVVYRIVGPSAGDADSVLGHLLGQRGGERRMDRNGDGAIDAADLVGATQP